MDLRQMRYFVAVAQERNFTRAAKVLNIAQPPLSRQIQLIEEELGVPLVIRKGRPVRLTEAGRLFYEQSMQILGRVEQMQAATIRVGLNQNSMLSIGFVASTLYAGLPSLVRKLRLSVPDVDIQLIELVSVQQIPALKEGRIDIGFGRMRYSDPNVVSIVLREEKLVAAIPKGTPLAQEIAPIPVAALAGQKIIVYPKEPRPGFADHILAMLEEHEAHPAEVQEVREIQTALGLVAAEAGICIVPASARQMRSDVHYRLLDSKGATSPVILNHRAGDNSRHINLVRQLAQEVFGEPRPGSDVQDDLGPSGI